MASLWRDSGLSWTDFLPEAEDVHAFVSQQVGAALVPPPSPPLLLSALIGCSGLAQQKLQFVLWDGSVPDAAPSKRTTLSPEDLSQQLDRLLLEDMASDEQIFDWVEVRRDWSRWLGGGGGPQSHRRRLCPTYRPTWTSPR